MANLIIEIVNDDHVYLFDPDNPPPDFAERVIAASIPRTTITTKGDIIAANSSGAPERLPLGTTGQVLTVDPATPLGVKWGVGGGGGGTDADAISRFIFDVKGDIIAASGADAAIRLAAGSAGQVLTVDFTTTTGLKWTTPVASDPDAIPQTLVTTKGDLIAATSAGTVARKGVGGDGQFLIADSNQTTGLSWANPSGLVAAKTTAVNGAGTGTVNLASGQLIPANPARAELAVWNQSATATIYLGLGVPAVIGRGPKLKPDGLPYQTNGFLGIVNAISTETATPASFIDV